MNLSIFEIIWSMIFNTLTEDHIVTFFSQWMPLEVHIWFLWMYIQQSLMVFMPCIMMKCIRLMLNISCPRSTSSLRKPGSFWKEMVLIEQDCNPKFADYFWVCLCFQSYSVNTAKNTLSCCCFKIRHITNSNLCFWFNDRT